MMKIISIDHAKCGQHAYVAEVIEEIDDGDTVEIVTVKQSGWYDSREMAQAWAELAITYFDPHIDPQGRLHSYRTLVEHYVWEELSYTYEGETILDAVRTPIDTQDGHLEDGGKKFKWYPIEEVPDA